MLEPLLTEHRLYDCRPFRLLADNAYSHPSTRRLLQALKIPHTIPERTDHINRRQAKGSLGERPPDFDADLYKERNTVERGSGCLRQWRGIASCYDKHTLIYLATIALNHRIRI